MAAVALLAITGGISIVTGRLSLATAGTGSPQPGIETPVTAMDLSVEPASNSPLLVSDPTERRFVVMANRIDSPAFSCALQVSGDGGQSWEPVDAVPDLPVGADTCYAPEVGFDRDGVLYYLFVGLHGAGNEPMGAFLTTSADRARTFSPPRQVLGPLNFGVRMGIDRDLGRSGRIHLLWLHATSDPAGGFGSPPNPILTAYSDDGGVTFSDPLEVSDPGRQRVVAPALALGPDHAVHVAYYDLKNDDRDYRGLEGPVWEGTWAVVAATSTDGGRSFGAGAVVDDEVGPPERVMLIFTMAPPSLAVNSGRTCVAWTDARSGDADALLRCSADGHRWAEPVRLNDDRAGTGRRQYLPRLAMAPDGRVDAIFYDRRDDPENLLNHVYYTFSTDGGRSFAPNVRITGDPSYSRIGQQYGVTSAEGQFEIGARLGLLSDPGRALAAWADTRHYLEGTRNQDIFVAEITVPEPETPGWVSLLGAALLLAGVASLALAARAWLSKPAASDPVQQGKG